MAKIVPIIILINLKVISSLNIQQLPQHLITPDQSEAKLSCRHGDTSYLYMYWYQQKTVSDSIEQIGVLVSQNPTLEEKFKTKFSISGQSTGDAFLLISSVTPEDSAVYFCAASMGYSGYQAYFGDGTKLTVLDKEIKITGPAVKVLDVSENEVCTKTNVTLVCVAEEFYPDHVSVSWSVDGDKRTTDVSTDEAAIQDDKTKFYSISSRLNINYKDEWTKGKTFTCTVSFFNGENYTEHSDSLTGPKLGGEDLVEKYIHSANVTMLAYGMFIGKSIAYGLFILYVIKRQGFISK